MVVDYLISYLLIKDSFLIGSLPSVGVCRELLHLDREVNIAMPKTSVLPRSTILVILSIFVLLNMDLLMYSYKLTVSASVQGRMVSYEFVKPVCNYFTAEGVLCRKVIEKDAVGIMDTFREMLRVEASKKKN